MADNRVEPFEVKDCSLARFAVGRSCSSLRELLDAIRSVPEAVIEHHMMRCALEDHFEMYEFPNDFARWCWGPLGEHVLGERLALIDPYRHRDIAGLRTELANVVEDHLWHLDRVPYCRPGLELHLVGSRLVSYDTGERITTPVALAEAIPRLSRRSLFYHVHEAWRRSGRSDDFSAWLAQHPGHEELAERIRAIDFHFLNLSQLRQELIEIFREYLPEKGVVPPA